jgi:hypothetical protein
MIADQLDAGLLVSPTELHAVTFRRPLMCQSGDNCDDVDEILDHLGPGRHRELRRRE